MKIKKKTLFLSAALSLCLILSVFTLAADEEYDSSVDPLISYSYLEARIGELQTNYENEITSLVLENEDLKNQLEALNSSYDRLMESVNDLVNEIEALKKNSGGNAGGNTDAPAGSGLTESDVRDIAGEVATDIATYIANEALKGSVSADMGFEVVLVPEGGVVYPTGDNLEVILRSGQAVVVSPFPNQGLSNITNGTDMPDGKSITSNHLLLIPRNDGRGVKVTSVGGGYMMIRGEYQIGN